MTAPKLGVMFLREFDPAELPAFARMVEATMLDDLWVIEDAFFNGGLAAAAVALAVTDRLNVGIGIQPAVVRNVAYNAMDLATLARIYPGRLEIGFGHGVADWVKQVGEFPSSQMDALETATLATRRLLQGENVSIDTPDIHLKDVQLVYPPETVPRVSLGVTGPRSLRMSGRAADGTIMVELTGPALIRANQALIAAGQAEAGRAFEPHQITAFAFWSQDDDCERARTSIRPLLANRLAAWGTKSLTEAGFEASANQLLVEGGETRLSSGMAEEWIDEIAVAGSPGECRAAINRLAEAGAARVCLVPPIGSSFGQIEQWLKQIVATAD